jgi:hypothetical protein
VGDTASVFPKESRPTAVTDNVRRVRTLADFGVTATEATDPGVTLTVCVPLVAPSADAVRS